MDLKNKIAFMQEALIAAGSVKGYTSPNPAVGAVVVKNDKVIATGATSPAGGPHAEIHAIKNAGDKCRGAHLFVTLEPCSHFGKTPPCADAIIKAKFSKVTVAILDPNEKVSGSGIKKLKDSGIEVDIGVCESEAKKINEDFFHYITKKSPWVTVKLALTLDGYIADEDGSSKWITSQSSRDFVHKLRATHTSIGVGNGTLNADNPSLTVRHCDGNSPIRFVFSSKNEFPLDSYFALNSSEVRSILVIAQDGKVSKEKKHGEVERWFTGSSNRVESIKSFLKMAGKEEIDSIFIEGGASLISSFMEAEAVNRFYLFYAPKIIGAGVSGLQLQSPRKMSSPIKLSNIEHLSFDEDFLVTGLANFSKDTDCLQD
jgi:diaminohydroxyphosphoribosylaminopyrimidine deaminase/5-amino-6-(5-phosphoribosylamino)uracil reductase